MGLVKSFHHAATLFAFFFSSISISSEDGLPRTSRGLTSSYDHAISNIMTIPGRPTDLQSANGSSKGTLDGATAILSSMHVRGGCGSTRVAAELVGGEDFAVPMKRLRTGGSDGLENDVDQPRSDHHDHPLFGHAIYQDFNFHNPMEQSFHAGDAHVTTDEVRFTDDGAAPDEFALEINPEDVSVDVNRCEADNLSRLTPLSTSQPQMILQTQRRCLHIHGRAASQQRECLKMNCSKNILARRNRKFLPQSGTTLFVCVLASEISIYSITEPHTSEVHWRMVDFDMKLFIFSPQSQGRNSQYLLCKHRALQGSLSLGWDCRDSGSVLHVLHLGFYLFKGNNFIATLGGKMYSRPHIPGTVKL
eukprot:767870-Hanusia_phi.AAC.1